MRASILLTMIAMTVSCKSGGSEKTSGAEEQDNRELIEIYQEDQADRHSEVINWFELAQRDSMRRVRVQQLLNSDKVRTSKDFKNAAMVFQHGEDSTDYGKAVRLMRRSVELDSTADKWLLAAATDRYLLSKGKPQIYGTQYRRMKGSPWKRADIDTTKITDEERKEYGVETLAQQREKLKEMNSKLSESLNEGKTTKHIN